MEEKNTLRDQQMEKAKDSGCGDEELGESRLEDDALEQVSAGVTTQKPSKRDIFY